VSSAPIGNTALTKFDALIIGSGAGGGTTAHVLCKAGLKVLVLEAGANQFRGLDDPKNAPVPRFSNDELKFARDFVWPDSRVEPRSWRNTAADGERTFVGDVCALPKTVGGGAVLADLKTPRFLPDDFRLGTLLGNMPGASWADWPVDYTALEPYYLYAEKMMGVQGAPTPFDGPRSAPYPMVPGVPMYGALKVADGIKKLGYSVYPFPGAVNSKPYDDRPACNDCGFCTSYGCPTNARGTPPVTALRKALLTGNCLVIPETRAAKLLTNATKTAVTGVEAIGPDGKRVTYTADRYVLAASPIEDARLLWLSGDGGNALGNSSDQVGRNVTFHLHTTAIGVFDERLHGHRGRTVSHGIWDFRGKPNDPDHPLGGIVEISLASDPISESAYYAQIMKLFGGYNPARMKKLMKQSPGRDRVIALAMVGEDAPQATNRVDLDPTVRDLDGLPVARVTYQNHAFELASADFYRPKLLDVLIASGARYAIPGPKDEIPKTAHLHGTLRSGNDPKTSVTDADGKFHDLGNLWASDGSLFPTGSGFNPTLTIVALATRVGAAMAWPGMPEKLFTVA
jgi:choline dehydrogenase-like flavoprotein